MSREDQQASRDAVRRILVLVPFPFDENGLAKRQAQSKAVRLAPDVELHYRPVKAGPAIFDSHHDLLLSEIGVFEAGLEAQRDGYDAVCIDTMSDSAEDALRSVLDIPVVAPARTSFLTALLLGSKFSVLTQWGRWVRELEWMVHDYGLTDKCASVRSIDMPPDVENLLGGKEEDVFPRLRDEALRCIEDGADVICLGSTTMHEAHAYLSENLAVPVINPGPLTYAVAQMLLDLGLSQSRTAFQQPAVEKAAMLHAMLDAAAAAEAGTARW